MPVDKTGFFDKNNDTAECNVERENTNRSIAQLQLKQDLHANRSQRVAPGFNSPFQTLYFEANRHNCKTTSQLARSFCRQNPFIVPKTPLLVVVVVVVVVILLLSQQRFPK